MTTWNDYIDATLDTEVDTVEDALQLLEELGLALKEDGYRVVKLAQMSYHDEKLRSFIKAGDYNITEELT